VFGIFTGLTGGWLLVFKMGPRYRRRSFAFGVINAGLLFIVTYVGLAMIGLFIIDWVYFSFRENFSSALSKSMDNVLFNMLSPSFFINVFLFGFLVSVTQFMLQVNDKFGPGILWKFITGKYYHPRQEERIFMFLDLRSSTTIAEKISSKFWIFSYLCKVCLQIGDGIWFHHLATVKPNGTHIVIERQVKIAAQTQIERRQRLRSALNGLTDLRFPRSRLMRLMNGRASLI